MHIVSRIQLPQSADVSSLYIQCNEGATINYQECHQEIVLRQGGTISTNSYFNSFYEKFYIKYTNLSSIYYLLKLEGDFKVSVYREVYEGSNRELISLDKFEKCQLAESVKVALPNLLQFENAGRIYFEITCLSEQGLLQEGLIATEQNKIREVSLGIISCTFKKEAYIKKTVDAILKDSLLQSKDFKIFIVDNGKTLNEGDFKFQNVQLIPNKNFGGSGGFTRGLIEAFQENNYSHFLLMDDDIDLESESIYRLFSLYEYAKLDFAISGSMLDLYKKYVLSEAGALFGKNPKTMEFAPFMGAPLKHQVDLQNATSLNLLLVEEENIDYGGFWFFSFSREIIEQIGLLLPLFIYLDDQEFGLRIKKYIGKEIIAFPSIAVWHEPSYAAKKSNVWGYYYFIRNHLITHAIHEPLGYITAIQHITRRLFISLLTFDYNSAQMLIKAFEDYLKGPSFIKNNDAEALHSTILKLSKTYNTQNVQQNELPPDRFEQPSSSGSLKKLISLLTLNGQLLPNFLTSNDDVFILQSPSYPGQLSKAFGKKRVFISQEGSDWLSQNERDKFVALKLLTSWFRLAAISSLKWSSLITEWKNASREFTSPTFWQQYLGIKK